VCGAPRRASGGQRYLGAPGPGSPDEFKLEDVCVVVHEGRLLFRCAQIYPRLSDVIDEDQPTLWEARLTKEEDGGIVMVDGRWSGHVHVSWSGRRTGTVPPLEQALVSMQRRAEHRREQEDGELTELLRRQEEEIMRRSSPPQAELPPSTAPPPQPLQLPPLQPPPQPPPSVPPEPEVVNPEPEQQPVWPRQDTAVEASVLPPPVPPTQHRRPRAAVRAQKKPDESQLRAMHGGSPEAQSAGHPLDDRRVSLKQAPAQPPEALAPRADAAQPQREPRSGEPGVSILEAAVPTPFHPETARAETARSASSCRAGVDDHTLAAVPGGGDELLGAICELDAPADLIELCRALGVPTDDGSTVGTTSDSQSHDGGGDARGATVLKGRLCEHLRGGCERMVRGVCARRPAQISSARPPSPARPPTRRF
jgi:hypothetical protein